MLQRKAHKNERDIESSSRHRESQIISFFNRCNSLHRRDKRLHNFTLPYLRWGQQRFLRGGGVKLLSTFPTSSSSSPSPDWPLRDLPRLLEEESLMVLERQATARSCVRWETKGFGFKKWRRCSRYRSSALESWRQEG